MTSPCLHLVFTVSSSEICIAAPKYVLPLRNIIATPKYDIRAACTRSECSCHMVTAKPTVCHRVVNFVRWYTVITRYEDGKRTWAGTRLLWIRSWGGAHIVLHSDGLRTCACRLCLHIAIYILVQQYIFQSGNTYFRATIHISDQQYIFQSSITYFRGVGMHTASTR